MKIGGNKIKSQSLIIVYYIVCLLLLLHISISNEGISIKYVREINITITNFQDEIEIRDNETENITVNGIVYCEMYGVNRVVVSLTASDTYGSAVVEPSTMLFLEQGGQEEPFTVSARIPQLSEGEYTETIEVLGQGHIYPGEQTYQIESESVEITVIVVNETSNGFPDIDIDGEDETYNESGIMLGLIIFGIIILTLLAIWIIKWRKRENR